MICKSLDQQVSALVLFSLHFFLPSSALQLGFVGGGGHNIINLRLISGGVFLCSLIQYFLLYIKCFAL